MRKFLIIFITLILPLNCSFCAVILPIKDIFNGELITLKGCQKLDETITKLNNNTILIEVFCNKKLNYNYDWELANIYAYKISKCLIEKGYNPHKIRYIGYGTLDIEKPEQTNVIKISIQNQELFK